MNYQQKMQKVISKRMNTEDGCSWVTNYLISMIGLTKTNKNQNGIPGNKNEYISTIKMNIFRQ